MTRWRGRSRVRGVSAYLVACCALGACVEVRSQPAGRDAGSGEIDRADVVDVETLDAASLDDALTVTDSTGDADPLDAIRVEVVVDALDGPALDQGGLDTDDRPDPTSELRDAAIDVLGDGAAADVDQLDSADATGDSPADVMSEVAEDAVGDDATAETGACRPDEIVCDAACTDARNDSLNCGACGNTCNGGRVCAEGVCVCPSKQMDCGGICRAIGGGCTAGSGGCESTGIVVCTGGTTMCSSVPRTSGACALPVGGVCNGSGSCVCPSGQTACTGVCRNTSTDVANCGACGRSCTSGQTCAGGVCLGGMASVTQRSCAVPGTPGCGAVMIPGGTFTMGAPSECSGTPDTTCGWQASPEQRNVTVSTFALDAYEVTVARFRAWVAAGRPVPSGPVMYRGFAMPFEGMVSTDLQLNCNSYANYPRIDRENHPINCVNWATAQAFCVWDGGRLPTQAEWEFAARGTVGRIYPWGSAPPNNSLVYWSGSGVGQSVTSPVGSLPAGAVGGVHDLAGNVSEWNADWLAGYNASGTGCWGGVGANNPVCNDRTLGTRVTRGATWDSHNEPEVRASTRGSWTPNTGYYLLGFRCAWDTP